MHTPCQNPDKPHNPQKQSLLEGIAASPPLGCRILQGHAGKMRRWGRHDSGGLARFMNEKPSRW